MTENDELSFWDHLDVLRSVIFKIIIVGGLCSLLAFCCKDLLFKIILAPKDCNFITYQILQTEPFHIDLVNTGLTEQFLVHMKAALFFGILCASPYIIYQLYKFIAPALYDSERKYSARIISSAYAMFFVGTLVNYFLIYPLTVRFLATYSVSSDVRNMLTIQSYMDTLLMMSLVFGLIFEIPVISWLLALIGMLKHTWMKQYRKHAFVAIVIIAAVITPTSDAFTLFIVSLPIWLLYEFSIYIVKVTEHQKHDETSLETSGESK